jgi:hypothetical protein
MKKDIFIDNNIAKDFATPIDKEYKELIDWLIRNDPFNKQNNAYLVVSNLLIKEYYSSAQNAYSKTCMPVIIDILLKDGRLSKFTNKEIQGFNRKYLKKAVISKLQCNKNDRDHISIICMSDRRMALSLDAKFMKDLANFPKFNITVGCKPSDIDYK